MLTYFTYISRRSRYEEILENRINSINLFYNFEYALAENK